MATQVFVRSAETSTPSRGTNTTNLAGTAVGWSRGTTNTSRGASTTSATATSVAGPTNGIELGGSVNNEFVSPPINADVTISGTITVNLWGHESSMNANAAINVIIERLDSTNDIISTIAQTTRTTELGTSFGVANFTVTPTSTDMLKGDRFRIRVYFDDAGTMGSGFTLSCSYDGPTAGETGDSYITFNETFDFLTTAPTGSKLFLTDVAGPAFGANVEKEMWTSSGDGANTATRDCVVGWTAPLQWTDTAGGTAIEWYSKRLSEFTLSDLVYVNAWHNYTGTNPLVGSRVELAVVDNNGTLITIWAAMTHGTILPSASTNRTYHLAGDDYLFTAGHRLRLRFFIDDTNSAISVGTGDAVLTYDGTVPNVSGDSYVYLAQTVTEYSEAPTNTNINYIRNIFSSLIKSSNRRIQNSSIMSIR